MRRFAAVFALFATMSPAFSPADDDLTVITSNAGETAVGKQLYAYLEAQARVHFDARRSVVAALATADDVAKRQAELRTRFLQALGDLPAEKSPLNAKVVGRERREGYSVERVIYESRPNHHVTANLYLPDGKPPYPGVLVPCGHSANGKAAETYQRISILLAQNGMAALCFDPIGQGERVQLLKEDGKPAISGSTTEHTFTGIGAWLVGRSAAGYRVWDAMRSLDYLASRPEIDPKRLGCTGNSGGGTETAYLMALDDRVAVAAPSCYITSLERLFATIGPQDAEQNIAGQVAFGMEHADYVTMRAPRPTLLSVGTKDFFDIQGSWTTFQEVKRIYCNLGYGERMDLFESNEPHGFTKPRRQAAMRWMRRWLLDKNDAPIETDFSIAPDRSIECTETGQVLTAFHGKSVFDLNAERAAALQKQRPGLSADALRAEIRKRLALRPLAEIIRESNRQIEHDNYTIDLRTLITEPGVRVATRIFRNKQIDASKPVVIYLGADRSLAAPGGPIEARVKQGQTVVMVEPRGMGETTPGNQRRPDLSGADDKEAFLSLHLDRPLLGQRVFDVLQTLRAVEYVDAPTTFHLIAFGATGPIALHTAMLEDRVKSVELDRSLLSWTALASQPISKGQLATVVPNVLQAYDFPDLAAAFAPRALTIQQPLDPAGKPVSQEVLDAAYALAREAYRSANAPDKLVLTAAP